MFHLEAGHACHTYFEYKKAADHFNLAKKIAGMETYKLHWILIGITKRLILKYYPLPVQTKENVHWWHFQGGQIW